MKLEIILAVILTVYAITLSLVSNWVWVAVMVSAALTLGAISALVGARKLFFLAGAAPHSGLLAALAAIPLSFVTGYDPVLIASLIGVLLVYMVGYAIHRGHDPDVSTSVFIAFSASLSVILAYYVLTSYPVQTDISAIILGDPLLATPREALFMIGLSIVAFVIVWTTYREQVSIGIDRDSARLAGIRVWVYDLVVFTLLGLAAAALL
ncbi:MAG: metal ABC transporter permease, partial [Crenarchaeota archaeon]|nr:metal ABC transporter permease [Thermoproteota archaeon]